MGRAVQPQKPVLRSGSGRQTHSLFFDSQVRYQGAARQEEQVTNLADFIHRYRPEAYKRNMANGVQAKTVSGLVYCRRRATVSPI